MSIIPLNIFNPFMLTGLIMDCANDNYGINDNFQFYKLNNSDSFVIRCSQYDIIKDVIIPLCECIHESGAIDKGYDDEQIEATEPECFAWDCDYVSIILSKNQVNCKYEMESVIFHDSIINDEYIFDIWNGIIDELDRINKNAFADICDTLGKYLNYFEFDSIDMKTE